MEGLTDSTFRRIHHKYFPKGLDRYYTPFFSPTVHRALTPREARELPPADSMDITVVPQLLTKVAEDFVWMSTQCRDLGYEEVNLNLGCPSGTVTAKGKGSGMLRDPDGLDAFLEEIFRDSVLPISIKTRIGFSDAEEFPRLMEVFNRYPIKELTVHPRIRSAFYKGDVDMEVFRYCVEVSKNPVCYNGDILSRSQAEALQKEFPTVDAVMIGRGLIGDPGMLMPEGTGRDTLEGFLNELMEEYVVSFGGPRNAMFRLKENWGFLIHKFENSDKLWKALRKTTDISEFRSITAQILHTLPMK
ncbi:MAG: tRNA-dihydrouridine synthase family protein [Oscillospiraceae bacterium]|nr:tRNA-dihydrouridine synthase family protein [Oscillospiraceae bacterium]